jgi:hypothetical protein
MTSVIFVLSFFYCYQSITASSVAGGAMESCSAARCESGVGDGFALKISHLLGISGFFWLLPGGFGWFGGFTPLK